MVSHSLSGGNKDYERPMTPGLLLQTLICSVTTQLDGPVLQTGADTLIDIVVAIILGGLALLGMALLIIARRDEALRVSQARLSGLIATALDGLVTIDHVGMIQSCNPAAEKLFGYEPGSLVGQPITVLMPAPYKEEHSAYLSNYLTTGVAHIIGRERELVGQKKDGTIFPMMLAVSEFRVGQDRFFTGVVRDITTRKQAEQADHEQRVLAEVLRDTAFVLSSTLEINTVVDSILTLVGRVVPHDDANIVLLDTGGGRDVVTVRGKADGGSKRLSHRGMTPELEQSLWEHNTILVADMAVDARWARLKSPRPAGAYLGAAIRHAGRTIGFINLTSRTPGFFTEMHANRLAIFANQAATALENARLYQELGAFNEVMVQTVEERTAQLQRAKDRVESVLGSSPDAMLLLDRNGGIQAGNLAFNELFGYEIDGLVGRSPAALLAEPSAGSWNRIVRKLNRGSQRIRQEAVAIHKDGTRFEVELAISPILGSDKLEGMVCSLRDIRALKHVERMKDAFVSNVSHELRTPVTSFKLFLRLLQRLPAEEHAAIIATLIRETDRLANIINDVLNLSRLDQGSIDLVRTEADMNAIIQSFISDRIMLARTRGIWLSFELSTGLPTILVDAGLAGQAVNVLLTNALNYTPATGQVVVRTALENHNRRQWLVCSVSDTGPGVSTDDKEFLFERFFRGQAGRESSAPGTGLGLSIAKEIMDRHGGKITVESAGIPGQGSIFRLWFPTARPRPSRPAARSERQPDSDKQANTTQTQRSNGGNNG